MPQYTTATTQTVTPGNNVRFTGTRVPCNKGCVLHDDGSGLITLRGTSNGCRARYRVSYNANIAVATGGTVGPVSLALTINGEPIYAATATVVPAAIGDFFNIHGESYIDVPCGGCCKTVSLENVINPATPTATATPVDVANATILITREA